MKQKYSYSLCAKCDNKECSLRSFYIKKQYITILSCPKFKKKEVRKNERNNIIKYQDVGR